MRLSVAERAFSAVLTVLILGVWGTILRSCVRIAVHLTED